MVWAYRWILDRKKRTRVLECRIGDWPVVRKDWGYILVLTIFGRYTQKIKSPVVVETVHVCNASCFSSQRPVRRVSSANTAFKMFGNINSWRCDHLQDEWQPWARFGEQKWKRYGGADFNLAPVNIFLHFWRDLKIFRTRGGGAIRISKQPYFFANCDNSPLKKVQVIYTYLQFH